MTTLGPLRPVEAAGEGPVLIVGPPTAPLWRELGALAWATLTELAVTARDDGGGLVAPVGARDVAARLGVNKDTAARALTALAGAGLVRRERVDIEGVGRRSAYRLTLSAGMALCPAVPDRTAGPTQADSHKCPAVADDGRRPPPRAAVCPASSDEAAFSDDPSGSAGVCPSLPDASGGSAVDGPAVAVSRCDVEVSNAVGLSEGVVGAGAAERCRPGVGDLAAEGGAQGQLFEIAVGSEDQPR